MFQSFSPNMLKTFEQCSRKFYFKYIKNISMPVNDEVFELGKNIHALASYYLKKENIDVYAKLKDDVMNGIVNGKMTFQRAFMTGEMTAKGNFKTLRMLDQVFLF